MNSSAISLVFAERDPIPLILAGRLIHDEEALGLDRYHLAVDYDLETPRSLPLLELPPHAYHNAVELRLAH